MMQAIGKTMHHKGSDTMTGPQGLEILDPAASYRVDRRVVGLAADVRGGVVGWIDPGLLAQHLGITVHERRLQGPLQGLTTSASAVVVRRGLSSEQRRFVLCHEIAHALVRQGRMVLPRGRAWAEEMFADAFACEVLLPCAEARQVGNVAAAVAGSAYGVEPDLAVLQIARANGRPRVLRGSSGSVLCTGCGSRPGPPACNCRTFRRALAS